MMSIMFLCEEYEYELQARYFVYDAEEHVFGSSNALLI